MRGDREDADDDRPTDGCCEAVIKSLRTDIESALAPKDVERRPGLGRRTADVASVTPASERRQRSHRHDRARSLLGMRRIKRFLSHDTACSCRCGTEQAQH